LYASSKIYTGTLRNLYGPSRISFKTGAAFPFFFPAHPSTTCVVTPVVAGVGTALVLTNHSDTAGIALRRYQIKTGPQFSLRNPVSIPGVVVMSSCQLRLKTMASTRGDIAATRRSTQKAGSWSDRSVHTSRALKKPIARNAGHGPPETLLVVHNRWIWKVRLSIPGAPAEQG